MDKQLKREDLVYAKECYHIMGMLMEVFKKLGPGFQEKYYQRGVAKEFGFNNVKFQEQVAVPLLYKGEKIGIYFLDFLIEYLGVKIVLEIKKDEYFSKHHIDQVFGYLKATGLQLGILANFIPKGVRFKRIVNLQVS